MNTLIPIEFYTNVFYNFLLLVVLFVFLKSNNVALDDSNNLKVKNSLGIFILIAVIFYMGFRPISGYYFGDMRTYSDNFEKYALGESIAEGKDIYFEYFMKWCSNIMSVDFFFLICAFLYIFPLFLFSKRVFNEYWFYSFLFLVTSFSFWSYGVNGIRNGIATSLFLLGISYAQKKKLIVLLFLAFLVHKSTLILIATYLVTTKYKNTKIFLLVWFSAIPLSLILGGFWEQFFLNLGFVEKERVEGYLSDEENEFQELFASIGFRWDFLLYSATGVFAGWYYIFKKKFEDVLYKQFYNFYLLTNAFWILVIRATFSNRFAYLSWFILGVIIVYPLLRNKIFEKQHAIIGKMIVVYFIFTYVLNAILVKS